MIMIIIIMIRLMITVIIKTLRKRMSKSDRTQDLIDYPNLHPEFRDSGMYHIINNMKKVNRGFITLPEHSSPFACCTLSIHHLDC